MSVDPDGIIEFGHVVEEGFFGLVEHQLLTDRGGETTLIVTEVRYDD